MLKEDNIENEYVHENNENQRNRANGKVDNEKEDNEDENNNLPGDASHLIIAREAPNLRLKWRQVAQLHDQVQILKKLASY